MAPLILCGNCQTSLPPNDFFHALETLEDPSQLPPYLKDKASVDQHLTDVQRVYHQYNEERRKAVLLLHKLDEEIDSMKQYMSRIRNIHAPYRRLVPDVLFRIFTFVVADREYALRDGSSTPVMLGQVCSLWRSVVRSSPRLWASLDIRRPITNPDDFTFRERIKRAIQHHRLQSTPYPLKLKIGPHVNYGLFLSPLMTDSDRWQECKIEHEEVIVRMSDPDCKLGALVSLCIPSAFRRVLPTLCFKHAHALREYKGPFTGVSLPWAQLTTVNLIARYHGLRGLLDCLKRCESVTSFTAQRLYVPTNDLDLPALHLPNLRHLALLTLDKVQPVAELVFPQLTAPNLTSLEVGFCNADGYTGTSGQWAWKPKTSTAALTDLLKRSGASLISLTLGFVDIKTTEVKALLTSLPALEHLRVTDGGGEKSTTNFVVKALTPPVSKSAKGGTCVPVLRDLELQTRYDVDWGKLMKMLRMRSVYGGGSLRNLTFGLYLDDDQADWARDNLPDLVPNVFLKVAMQ
ncbi:hypothetical protein K523DRAFT_292140 [Schizophyllum commune Tattone D]|nr:hypothetical protein K523DRAFT_292140 [Schizophyllum commune Tattone D]